MTESEKKWGQEIKFSGGEWHPGKEAIHPSTRSQHVSANQPPLDSNARSPTATSEKRLNVSANISAAIGSCVSEEGGAKPFKDLSVLLPPARDRHQPEVNKSLLSPIRPALPPPVVTHNQPRATGCDHAPLQQAVGAQHQRINIPLLPSPPLLQCFPSCLWPVYLPQ